MLGMAQTYGQGLSSVAYSARYRMPSSRVGLSSIFEERPVNAPASRYSQPQPSPSPSSP
jgi:hypothetical protein